MRPAFGPAAWLLFAVLLLHMTEEWFRFPAWATRHFGTTSPRFYALSHIPIVALAAWICSRAASPRPTRASATALILAATAFLTNLGFHAGASVAFAEYSPGLATAVLYLPVTAYLWHRAVAVLGPAERRIAGLAGVALSVVVTASLVLDVPV